MRKRHSYVTVEGNSACKDLEYIFFLTSLFQSFVYQESSLDISSYRTIAAVDVSSLNIEALAIMSAVCCKPSSDVTGSDVAAFMTDVRTCTNQQRNDLKE